MESNEFNSTEVLDGWDLVNQLKDETDAILASTRSMFTSKRKESFRVGILKPPNHSKASKFNIYSDSSADEDINNNANSNKKTKKGTKKKKYMKKGRKVLGTLSSSGTTTLPDLNNNNKYLNQENTNPNLISVPDLLTQPIYGGGKVLKDKKPLASRLTLEILDDASPDSSPRLKKKSIVDHANQAAKAESHIKELKFNTEILRVATKKDVFIPSAGSTLESLAQEKNRLDNIQKIAQNNANKYQHNVDTWNNNLQKNESATQLQKLIRGVIGRKRSNLARFMKGFEAESDWIEVRDRSSGESWYYNRMNGISQWNRPEELDQVVGNKAMMRTLPQMNDSVKKKQKELSISKIESIQIAQDAVPAEVPFEKSINKKTLNSKSMNNISMNMSLAHTQTRPAVDKAVIDRELEDEYGTHDAIPRDLLHYPNGIFKPDLKRTVQDALLSTRFDTLSSVLSDDRWLNSDKGAFKHMNERKKGNLLRSKSAGAMNNNTVTNKKADTSRRPMTAKFKPPGLPPKGLEPMKKMKARDMTVHKVNHPGYDEFLDDDVTVVDDVDVDSDDNNQNTNILTGYGTGTNDMTGDQPICFGCWSCGGAKKCQLHTNPDDMVEPSKTMLLCRNWDLGIMRRRYRSEEIQEMFLKKSSSLKYDAKRKKFLTVVEARHIVYKLFQEKLHQCNVKMQLVEKGKRWLNSLVDEVRAMRVPHTRQAQATAQMLKLVRTLKYGMHVRSFTRGVRPLLPIGASTGYSWEERTNEIQYLYTIFEKSLKENVEIIQVFPIPKPIMLYKKRKYHLPTPRAIPIPKPSRGEENNTGVALTEHINYHMPTDNLGSWLERLSRKISRQVEQNALVNVHELCPTSGLESLRRMKIPDPTSIQFANLGRKPTRNMLARGGLPWELLVGELISTYIPPQYGNFMVMDKAVVNPGIHPEENITFDSLPMKPIPQAYCYRALEHPLVTRRPPTISLCSHIQPDEKYYWCRNRPEQTGEIEPHGMRTSAWATALLVFNHVDTTAFSPHEAVATVNEPSSNLSNCTHVDLSYPFCEPSTQDNSSLDYYHFLLQGVFSPNHAQIFTALTVQEPGEFLRGSNINGQLGRLIISVYRSWGFAQKTQLQGFHTDDGVPYWYNRESGQTYWEKPFLEEEEKCPLDGGTKLDRNHTEEPTAIVAGKEGYSHRYNQGEQRENMLHHVESTGEALRRRKKVAASAAIAREKLRELGEDLEDPSVTVHPPTINGQPSIQMQNFGGSKGPSSAVHDGSLADSEYTRISTETSLLNDHGKKLKAIKTEAGTTIMVPEAEHSHHHHHGHNHGDQHHGGDKGVTFVRGSALDGNSIESLQPHNNHNNNHHNQHNQGQGQHSHGHEHGHGENIQDYSQGMNLKSMNMMPSADQSHLKSGIDMIASIENSEMIAKAVGSMLAHTDAEHAPTEDIVQIGVNMGVALMKQSASIRSSADTRTTNGVNFSTSSRLSNGKSIIPKNFDENYFPSITETDFDANGQMVNPNKIIEHNNPHAQPIGVPQINNDNKGFATTLDHDEQVKQENHHNNLADKSLSGMEKAMEARVVPKVTVTDPPDVIKEKILHGEVAGSAEEATRYTIPVVLYPNLSTQVPGGAPNEVETHKAAGDGTSFVTKEKADTMHLINPKATGKPGDPILRRATVPLPVGFFEKIVAKNIATQSVDYLPQIPNLPQTRTVGNVRPRSVSMDWLAIGFDPWSAGKKPLSAEFVSSLSSKAHEFFADQPALAQTKVDELRQNILKDEYIQLEDVDGKNATIKEVNTQQQLYNDFNKISSLVRHSKFQDVCDLLEQPDWNCPIDYQDEAGNTLLHVCCQNGNKRLVKICVGRGADVNLQNIHGQTPLHFAYGYGYENVGEYLLKIGADDSLLNVDGLTPYEGLGMQELNLL